MLRKFVPTEPEKPLWSSVALRCAKELGGEMQMAIKAGCIYGFRLSTKECVAGHWKSVLPTSIWMPKFGDLRDDSRKQTNKRERGQSSEESEHINDPRTRLLLWRTCTPYRTVIDCCMPPPQPTLKHAHTTAPILQVEFFVADKGLTLGDLMGLLQAFFTRIGIGEMLAARQSFAMATPRRDMHAARKSFCGGEQIRIGTSTRRA